MNTPKRHSVVRPVVAQGVTEKEAVENEVVSLNHLSWLHLGFSTASLCAMQGRLKPEVFYEGVEVAVGK